MVDTNELEAARKQMVIGESVSEMAIYLGRLTFTRLYIKMVVPVASTTTTIHSLTLTRLRLSFRCCRNSEQLKAVVLAVIARWPLSGGFRVELQRTGVTI